MRATIRVMLAVVFLAVCCSAYSVGQEAGPNGNGTMPAFNPAPLGSEEHPARVSGGVIAGQVLHKESPIYPQMAKDAKVAGAVVLAILIDDEGEGKEGYRGEWP